MHNPAHARAPQATRAFSSLGCGELELDAALALARRYAIPAVELRALGGSTDLPGYFSSRFGEPARLRDALVNAPARIVSLDTSLRLIGNTMDQRAAMLDHVRWAEACGAATLRVFDGGQTGCGHEIDNGLATLRWWRSLREAHGWHVDLAVETHDAFAHEAGLRRFLDAQPRCRILWDAHHTWRKGGADPVRTWDLVRKHVRHIHVKDSVDAPHAAAGHAHVLPGRGRFPMDRLLATLHESCYDGVISLEWERHWHPELPDLDRALDAASRGWWD